MANLADILLTTPQREEAGARTLARYHYQALWGVTLLIEIHSKRADYAIVFEFHDDVALLDSSSDPKKIAFFQIKTKDKGFWTLPDLLKTKVTTAKLGSGTNPTSILGKMYQNVIHFGDDVEKITFVSNAHLNLGPKSEDFGLMDCNDDELTKVVEKLQLELPGTIAIKSELVRFSKTDLSLADADNHAKGKLQSFIVSQLGDIAFSLDTMFRAVVGECERKSRVVGVSGTLADVVRRKGVTRGNVVEWLNTIKQTIEVPAWLSIANELGFPAMEKTRVEQEWNKYKVKVLDPDEAIRSVRREISRHLANDRCEGMAYMEIIEDIFPKVETYAKDRLSPIRNEAIKVMILYEALTGVKAGELQDTDPEFAEKTQ